MLSLRSFAAVLLICLLLAGCASATPEQYGASEDAAPAVALEATVAPLPTDTPAPITTPAPTPVVPDTPVPASDWTQTAAQVDGVYVLGNPNAPIRLIDYSDFF